jgi:endo-1,4-beta-xylanase
MKKIALCAAIISLLVSACGTGKHIEDPIIKDAFKDKFLMGVAVNRDQIYGIDSVGAALIAKQFNSVVPENVMKCEVIHPAENVYFWDDADAYVKFGEEHNMFIVGHCLIWHSQLAPWFCVDDNGELVDSATLKHRMRDHIHTIVGRYKGRIKGWDVVNEAIIEDGSYRESPFYKILGEEFIPLAFQYAHEADPDAELYYNDYGMDHFGRRNTVVKMVNDLKKRGLRIDAIGMQGHMGMDNPDFKEFEASLEAFAGTGCKVSVTEWDMSALPTISLGANISDTVAYKNTYNPFVEKLPYEESKTWNERMYEVMQILLRHSDVVERVCVWGLEDGGSWRNDWPIHGRTDYPTYFDRNYQMKPFMVKTIEELENTK